MIIEFYAFDACFPDSDFAQLSRVPLGEISKYDALAFDATTKTSAIFILPDRVSSIKVKSVELDWLPLDGADCVIWQIDAGGTILKSTHGHQRGIFYSAVFDNLNIENLTVITISRCSDDAGDTYQCDAFLYRVGLLAE